MIKFFKKNKVFDKKFIFISGSPRSGTSMLTKVVDAHPDIAILMENILDNRRRHLTKADFWSDDKLLEAKLNQTFGHLKENVLGNKVIIPDIWSAVDVFQLSKYFKDFRLIFIVRNPQDVMLSRLNRERLDHYTNEAIIKLGYAGLKNTEIFAESWKQSILSYYELLEYKSIKSILIYYDDFVMSFEKSIQDIFKFLEIPFDEKVLEWDKLPHHDSSGVLKNNLKYSDSSVNKKSTFNFPKDGFESELKSIEPYFKLWNERKL